MPPGDAYATLVAMGGKLDCDLVRVFGEVVLDAEIGRLGQYGKPVLKRAAGHAA